MVRCNMEFEEGEAVADDGDIANCEASLLGDRAKVEALVVRLGFWWARWCG